MDGPQPSMLPFETNFCQAGSRKLFTTAHASATEMMACKLRFSKPPCKDVVRWVRKGSKWEEKLATFIMDGLQPSMLPFETNFCQAGSRKLFTTAHASATEMMARKLRYSKPPCTKPSPLCVAFWPVGSHNTIYTYVSRTTFL